MALSDLIRTGVKLAHQITKDGKIQETVSLHRWRSSDADGVHTYATAVTLTALVEHKRKAIRRVDGTDIMSTASATILTDIAPLSPAVTGRKEPVDERDKLVLADGSTGPIVATDGGLKDPKTTRPYLVQVFLG